MPTLRETVDGFVASRQFDQATLSRLSFWVDQFGDRELVGITDEDVDNAVVTLASRGKLIPNVGGRPRRAGKPLAPSTINRHISQLGSVYKFARKMRLVPRSFVAPTANADKSPEQPDPDRYLRPEEVDRLINVARIVDRGWGKMVAVILTVYHTDLRKSDVMNLKGRLAIRR